MTWTGPLTKPSATERKKAKLSRRRDVERELRKTKQTVLRQDGGCRFPFCRCRDFRLKPEVAHLVHQGAGGVSLEDPEGRNAPENLITLCPHRHRTGKVSMHRGTLRVVPKTDRGTRGPVIWEIDRGDGFTVIAQETGRGRLEQPTWEQAEILLALARLED